MAKNDIGERMARLETDITYIKDGVDSLTKKFDTHIECSKQELADLKKENDQKYASKVTEKIVYGLVGAILLAVLAAILNLIVL